MSHKDLSIREELDFHYLLELMPPLHNVPEFAWLPELFAIIGHEKLIMLSKYAGGETITIPTLTDLLRSVDALQWFYDVNISKTRQAVEIPSELIELYSKIAEVYHVRDNTTTDNT